MVGFSVALLVGEASAKEVAAMGAGTSTCAQFAIRYRASPELVESEYYTWAQGFMSARIEPRIAAAKPLDMKLAALEVPLVQIGDLEFAPRRWLQLARDIDRAGVVKI